MMFPGEGSFVKSEQLTLTMSSGLSQHGLGDIHFFFFFLPGSLHYKLGP